MIKTKNLERSVVTEIVTNNATVLLRKLTRTSLEHTVREERGPIMQKAIAYTADIILGRTGEVISRAYQKELIRQYAEENGLEVAAWFEDEVYEEELLKRPGIQAMLGYEGPAEVFLVERVWAVSRKMATLAEFFKVLNMKKVKLETATYLWDCTSQMVRRQLAEVPAVTAARVYKPVVAAAAGRRAGIAVPERFHFVGWAFDPKRA